MQFVTRLADSQTATTYPLICSGNTTWEPRGTQGWRASVRLPDVPPQHIIVPSFTTRQQPYRFQFELIHSGCKNALQPVPARPEAKTDPASSPGAASAAVTAHIDCWHTSSTARDITLELVVCTPTPPDQYLIALSIRPLDHETGEYRLPTQRIVQRQPRRFSQMRGRKEIRQRICSPTALAMALSDNEPDVDWAATVEACFDPLTKAYGSWPLAMHWASRQGRLGAVETFYDWENATNILANGTPMVCSIRFAANELHNAPLKQSSGHLVTLYGVDKNVAYVFDPAGKNIRQVARKYILSEFSNAWLARRGAAYVFCRRS